MRYFFLLFVLALPNFGPMVSAVSAADQPNILWLSCEDMSPHLGCYGDPVARTPRIDALAASGIRFERAFVVAPVCSVSRSAIITGVYPTSLGTLHHRSRVKLPARVRCFTEYLHEAGYYCTNNSKQDYNFRPAREAWDESSNQAHWRNRPRPDQPFFAVFNFEGTHESFIRGDQPKSRQQLSKLSPQQRVDPTQIAVPPYLPDVPDVRSELARNYDNIAVLDMWVGEHLAALEKAGLADNTIVFFWSDHGIGMPRGKRWLYDSGTHIPLIVHVPPKFAKLAATADSRDLVSTIDLAPTVLALAGIERPAIMDGRNLLNHDSLAGRKYVYASRDRMDESYDSFRSARDERWLYIRNILPWRPAQQHNAYGEVSPTMHVLRAGQAAGTFTGDAGAFMVAQRPLEELYDTQADPYQVRNLVAEASHQQKLIELRGACLAWMHECRDLGAVPESILTTWNRQDSPLAHARRDADAMTQRIDAMWHAAEPTADPHADLASPDEVIRYWSAVGYDGSDLTKLTKLAAHDASYAVRVGAAERLLVRGERDQAVQTLLEVIEQAPQHFDAVTACGVLDTIPDLQPYANQLQATLDTASDRLDENSPPQFATDFLRQRLKHLRARTASTKDAPRATSDSG